MYEFKIDFTKGLPYRFCPDTHQAATLYLQCVANAPQDIEFRKVKDGLFYISVNKEEDKKKLMNKFLLFDFTEKTHVLHTAKVPLQLMEKRK